MRDLTQIVVPALRPASPIHQKQIGHCPFLPAESRLPATSGSAFRRGGRGRENGNRRPGGAAGAQRPPHGGVYSGLGTRGQSPWHSLKSGKRRRLASPQPQRGAGTAPLWAARRRRMVCARACAPAPIRQGERQECQRVSAKMPRPQERQRRGTERVLEPSRSLSLLPIATRVGRDYRPGPRQRIERVAQRAAQQVSLL